MTKEEQLVQTIADALNGGLNHRAFYEAMDREHRYLQSEWMQLLVMYVEHAASEKYQYDGRNEWVHRQAKALYPYLF